MFVFFNTKLMSQVCLSLCVYIYEIGKNYETISKQTLFSMKTIKFLCLGKVPVRQGIQLFACGLL